MTEAHPAPEAASLVRSSGEHGVLGCRSGSEGMAQQLATCFQKEGARACNLNLRKRLLTSTQRPPTRQTQPRLPRRAEKCTDNSQRQEPQDHVPNVTLSRSDLCLWAHRLPKSPLASSYTPRLSDDTPSRCSHNSFQQTNVGPTQLTGTNLK